MALDDLAPCSGAHAVQSAVFAIEWSNPLPQDALSHIRAAYDQSKELKRQFSAAPQEQRILSVLIDQAAGAVSPQTVSSGGECIGYKFTKQSGISPSRTLQITKDSCLYIVQDYTRWKSVVSDVLRAYSELSEYLVKSPVAALGLQYTDVFHWRADPEQLELAEVLNIESGLIPASALARKGLWHSHHGYLDDKLEPADHSVLENINVDIVDNGGQRSIAIVTSHQARLRRLLYDAESLSSSLQSFYEYLHNQNKVILERLLTSEVKRKIKLQRDQG
jgi:uncharacterized protein (TIGR04255 family)